MKAAALPNSIAACLAGLAGVAGTYGQPARAPRLFSAAVLMPVLNAPMHRIELVSDMMTARAQLDDAAWDAAWAEGQAMTLEQAITYAREETSA